MNTAYPELMTTQQVVRDAKQNGGGTYSLYEPANYTNGYENKWLKMSFNAGYMVAEKYGADNLPTIDVNLLNMVAFHRIEVSNQYLGLWQDGRGNWSLDQTVCIMDREVAIVVAKDNDQVAIWDNAKNMAYTL